MIYPENNIGLSARDIFVSLPAGNSNIVFLNKFMFFIIIWTSQMLANQLASDIASQPARQSANKPARQLASELGSQPDRQPGSHPLRENMNLLRNNIFELPAGRDTTISLAERPMLFSG